MILAYMGDRACVRVLVCDENLKWKNENNKHTTIHTHIVYPDANTFTLAHSVPKLTSARKKKLNEKREREKEQHHTYVCSSLNGRFSWNSASRWFTLFHSQSGCAYTHTVVLLYIHFQFAAILLSISIKWRELQTRKKTAQTLDNKQENVNI